MTEEEWYSLKIGDEVKVNAIGAANTAYKKGLILKVLLPASKGYDRTITFSYPNYIDPDKPYQVYLKSFAYYDRVLTKTPIENKLANKFQPISPAMDCHTCTKCQSTNPAIYVSMMSVECINPKCENYKPGITQ